VILISYSDAKYKLQCLLLIFLNNLKFVLVSELLVIALSPCLLDCRILKESEICVFKDDFS
jgi:hypothetical protein